MCTKASQITPKCNQKHSEGFQNTHSIHPELYRITQNMPSIIQQVKTSLRPTKIVP
jgi:hypothetical protein